MGFPLCPDTPTPERTDTQPALMSVVAFPLGAFVMVGRGDRPRRHMAPPAVASTDNGPEPGNVSVTRSWPTIEVYPGRRLARLGSGHEQ